MTFSAVAEAREDAKAQLGTLREAMRLRREKQKQTQTSADDLITSLQNELAEVRKELAAMHARAIEAEENDKASREFRAIADRRLADVINYICSDRTDMDPLLRYVDKIWLCE